MVVEGFWTMRFEGPQVAGTGVVMMKANKLYGGESGFYYIGNYEVDGNIFKARIAVKNFDPKMPSGFGIKGDYEMDVSGVVKDDSNMTGTAMITGAPQYNIGIRLTKRANL
jgi:hypothetical protein